MWDENGQGLNKYVLAGLRSALIGGLLLLLRGLLIPLLAIEPWPDLKLTDYFLALLVGMLFTFRFSLTLRGWIMSLLVVTTYGSGLLASVVMPGSVAQLELWILCGILSLATIIVSCKWAIEARRENVQRFEEAQNNNLQTKN